MKFDVDRTEYKRISTKQIYIDPLYQRDLDNAKVQRIVKNYDPLKLNPLKVSFRDGRYYVFDGQHTRAALIRMHNGHDCLVPCRIYYGLTRVDEMNLFLAQNGEASPVAIAQKYRALYNFGDPDITDMVRACEYAKVLCDFTNARGRNKCICYRTLYEYYRLLDRATFITMLSSIRSTWNGDSASFRREIISGYGELFLAYGDKLDIKRLIKKLSEISCYEIIREGRIGNAPGGKKFARIILHQYNRGLRNNALEDKF